VLIDVVLYGRDGFRPAIDRGYRARTLPLAVAQGVAQHNWEGGHGLRYAISGMVDGWHVSASVYFGATEPTAATRRLADEQLARLTLPDPCPHGTEPVRSLDASRDAVRAILVRGKNAVLTARPATAADPLPASCGDVPRDHVAVVEVQDRAETYLVSVRSGRERVWARLR
jgi:hypothetical protein